MNSLSLKTAKFALLLCFLLSCIGFTSQAQILLENNYIRVDQFGYLPNGVKYGVIAKAEKGFNIGKGINLDISKKVELRKVSDKSMVFEATAASWNGGGTDAYSGDKGWWFNFSSYTTPGEFFIRAYKTEGGFVDSYPFNISVDVYANALKAAVNMFYYQRINQEKTGAYASGEKWTDKAWFEGANQEKAATYLKDQTKTKNISKGWFDAGDPNKYVTFAVEPVHDLLTTYGQYKSMWDKFNLNIPESNNSIPDILDEVKWEIDWVVNMQDDATGGLHIKAGILNDPAYISPPSNDTRKRYYDVVCPSASITGSGMMAHAAYVFKEQKDLATYAADLQKRAELAWDHYEKAPDKTIRCDNGEIEAGDADGPGDQYPIEHLAEANCAAIYLFALTGKAKYKDFIKANYQQARPWKATDWGIYRPSQSAALLFYTTLPDADPIVKNDILNKKTSAQKSQGSTYEVLEAENLYRAKTLYANWGSNSLMSRQANDNMDFLSYNIMPSDHGRFKEKAQGILNYMHGVNPLGICYLSNMYQYGAEFCVNEMWHSWFNTGTKYDNIDNGNVGPAPGFLSGGFNTVNTSTMKVKIGTDYFNENVSAQPTQKAFSNDNAPVVSAAPWAWNEPGIYYNSGYVKLLAHFVAGNAAPVSVSGITLTATQSTIQVDESIQIKANITPGNATNQSVTWASSNAIIATISNSGLLTAKAVGTVTITATTQDGNKIATLNLNVEPVPVLEKCGFIDNNGFEAGLSKWINTNNAAVAGEPAKTGKKAAVISSEGGVNGSVRYKVSVGNQLVLKFWAKLDGSPLYPQVGIDYFDATGKIIFKEIVPVSGADYKEYSRTKIIPEGTVEVGLWSYRGANGGVLYFDDFCLTEEKAVNVAVTGIKTSPASITLKVNETSTLTVAFTPDNASNKALTWASSNINIVTVNSAGLLTAKAQGTATITATSTDGSKTSSTSVVVEAAPALLNCGSIDNPGFEGSLAKWENVNNAAIITDIAKTGTKAALITGDGGVNYSSKIDIGPDVDFEYSVWAKIEGSPTAAMVGIDYFNAAGTEIGENILTITGTEYTQFKLNKKTPANTAKVQFWTYKGSANGKMYLDDFCFTSTTIKPVLLGFEPSISLFSVFPNPSHSTVTINLNTATNGPLDLNIADQQGRNVLKRQYENKLANEKIQLDIKDLPSGIYFLNINHNGFKGSYKIVKL